MYHKSKYVVGELGHGVFKSVCALIGPENTGHVDIARAFNEGTVISAGFCHSTDEEVFIYGESVTLQLKSRDADKILVGRALAHQRYASDY